MSKKNKNYLGFIDNLSKNTQNGYEQAISKYEKFHGISIEELIDEALEEQTQQVPPHMLSVIDRIESFQDYLITTGIILGTIKVYVGKIKTLYKNNRVVLPFITPINAKRVKRREYIEFKDILTKDELRCALNHMRLPAQARAMAMIQGGLSNEECDHLTLTSFFNELRKYHQCDDILDALEWLSNKDNPVIWVTKMIRVKTGKPYYAIIGAEAVNYIASAKIYEYQNKNKLSDKLLNTNKAGFIRTCRETNNKCGFGLVAEESKFRPHMMRKFNATYIGGSALSYEENSLITNAEIDEMQGRGKTSVQDTYIKTNPIRQKVLYAKVMNNVSLFNEYEYKIVGDDVIVSRIDPKKKTRKLQEEVRSLSQKLEEKEHSSEKVNALRKELGDDILLEMIEEILNAS